MDEAKDIYQKNDYSSRHKCDFHFDHGLSKEDFILLSIVIYTAYIFYTYTYIQGGGQTVTV